MEAFFFHNPTKVIFGANQIANIGSQMKRDKIDKCILVAGGGSIKQNGVYEQVVHSLEENGVKWVESWGIQPNPTLEKLEEIINLARKEEVQAVLAVGGGSVLDTGKATAAGFYMDDIWNAYIGEDKITKALPIYTVLTLSATGSEMNGNAVITNMQTKEKICVSSGHLYPRLSIIDPAVQNSLPFKHTASGAMDAMAHIFEYYFANDTALSTLAINEALTKTIVESTDRLQANPADINARSNLAWSSTLALNGMTGAGLGYGDWGCHAIEHAISALRPHVSHGEGLGVIFPAWIEYLSEKDPMRFSRWAKEIWGESSATFGVKQMRLKLSAWGMPLSLRDLGLHQEDLPILLDMITKSGSIGNIFKLGRDEIHILLMLCF
jgi:alcohol dehydrogenase YqhD (iron-dependent ADH family)